MSYDILKKTRDNRKESQSGQESVHSFAVENTSTWHYYLSDFPIETPPNNMRKEISKKKKKKKKSMALKWRGSAKRKHEKRVRNKELAHTTVPYTKRRELKIYFRFKKSAPTVATFLSCFIEPIQPKRTTSLGVGRHRPFTMRHLQSGEDKELWSDQSLWLIILVHGRGQHGSIKTYIVGSGNGDTILIRMPAHV